MTEHETLAWDSAHFGVSIGRVRGDVDAAIAWMERDGVRCAYRLVPIARTEEAAPYLARGFRLVDVRVTLDAVPTASDSAAGLRAGTPADLDALAPIAVGAYRDSRFYRDGRFATDRCDALYRIWLEKSLSGERADHVVVAELEGRPVGFVTCSLGGEDDASIGLVGVAVPARGRGLARAMVSAATAWLADRGAARVTVVTQGRNLGAQRVYQACGFRTADVALWLHGWDDEIVRP